MMRAASRCIAGVTWLYTSSVIATVEWPSISETIFGWTPRLSRRVAAECRALWNGIAGTWARSSRALQRFQVVVTERGRPSGRANT